MNYNNKFPWKFGEGDPRTLSEWAMYIAAARPDITGEVSVTGYGHELKKTYLSGVEALLDQANKEDSKWYLFCGGKSWQFYKVKLAPFNFSRPDMVIQSCSVGE